MAKSFSRKLSCQACYRTQSGLVHCKAIVHPTCAGRLKSPARASKVTENCAGSKCRGTGLFFLTALFSLCTGPRILGCCRSVSRFKVEAAFFYCRRLSCSCWFSFFTQSDFAHGGVLQGISKMSGLTAIFSGLASAADVVAFHDLGHLAEEQLIGFAHPLVGLVLHAVAPTLAHEAGPVRRPRQLPLEILLHD
jgi:hypothetical protein